MKKSDIMEMKMIFDSKNKYE